MAAVEPVGAAAAAPDAGSRPGSDIGSAERFLKLLVAQMQNQDPLNPLDNAQVTSQVAQINTVSGIEKLNRTLESMAGQFGQLQALQGASLVGRWVVVEGNALSSRDDGPLQGGFDLAAPADGVKVEILSGGGALIDIVELGALGAGRHGFDWTPPDGADGGAAVAFRVDARAGATAVAATPLMRDLVDAVSTEAGTLTLELRGRGSVPYGQVRAFN